MAVLKKRLYFCLLSVSFCYTSHALDNGLARTPPMGWLAWGRFRCNINCLSDPATCISERLFMEMADAFIKEGYRNVGYQYIDIDDCWMASSRDSNGKLRSDPDRFPHGIKFLAEYMHERGLKLGIYENFGVQTCMGYPGSINNLQQDANTFAEWEVDLVKLDGCFTDIKLLDPGYMEMGFLLNKTHRPMVYSCSWPYYQLLAQKEPKYNLISKNCNMWRNYHDIEDTWKSIETVIEFFGDNQEVLTKYTGPGKWSDPDMLMIGNFGLTQGQSRAQIGIWSMIPAPLLMSNDLRKMKPAYKRILQNRQVIAINQDPLGLPGKRIYKQNQLQIWRRPISPQYRNETSYALLFLNNSFHRKVVKGSFHDLGLKNKNGYLVQSVFDDKNNPELGLVFGNMSFSILIDSMDIVMYNCKVIT